MTANLVGKTLLIVEDEIDLREPLIAEFESLGCKVFGAKNGRDGFEILKREKVDAVISDIRMPGGDGVELLRNIKTLNHEFPVVMLITGFSDLSREDAYDLGAEAILAKPFDLDEIDAAVSHILTPREERWRHEVPAADIKLRVEKTFADFAKAAEEGGLGLGRGGLFLKMAERLPPLGARVAFRIQFADGSLSVLEGSGIVRWTRYTDERGTAEGFGVEFESLSEVARADVLRITRLLKTQAYIPKMAPNPAKKG